MSTVFCTDAIFWGKIELSLEVLRRVYRRTKAFFEGLEVSTSDPIVRLSV